MITLENYFEQSRNIDFDTLPAALKNGDKLTRGAAPNNWSAYNSNENIKRVINAYLEKLNEYLAKKPQGKPKKKAPQPAKVKPETKPLQEKKATPEAQAEEEPESVEKILPEIAFIKRYVSMHGKTKTQDDVLRFLSSLQKAILEKRIRKTSKYASEIQHIQNQLIKCYEKMGASIAISIDKKTLEKYTALARSQKTMLSVTYIKQYISLHGKKNVKDKAKALLNKIKKAADDKKVRNNDPYADRLKSIYTSLQNYITDKTITPEISKSELNGLLGLAGITQKKSPSLNGPEKEETPEVIRSSDLADMKFETIGLQGKYRQLIGDPSVGFCAMVYGLPKSGKSTLCIDFAKHLAENHGKVLYCAIEEKFGYTLKEKIERLQASHPNLFVSETIPDDLSKYDFVFIDSVSRAGLNMDTIRNLRHDNPRTAFIFIYHTTKEGNFRGKNENAHEVDVIVEVADGKATGNGRFGIGGKLKAF
jgi:hypothetical protein